MRHLDDEIVRCRWLSVALCCGLLASVGGLFTAVGCGTARKLPTTQSAPPVYTYVDDVQHIFARTCNPCHDDARAEGTYKLNHWSGVVAEGSQNQRNVVPGSPSSRLLGVIAGSHRPYLTAEEATVLNHWVVEDRLAYTKTGFHPRDWVYPGNRNSIAFHGGALRAARWDTTECQQCHGANLGEGTGTDCYSCHREGPLTGCTTCHGSLVRFGLSLGPNLPSTTNRAHQVHANPQVTDPLACSECHLVPNSAFDAGHLYDDAQRRISDLRAEVTFGAKARMGGVQPSYDAGTGTCVVYCHGAKVGETPPTSNTTRGESECDFCHNIANHGKGVDCSQCHQESVARCSPGSPGCATITPEVGIRFYATRFHIDGRAPARVNDGEATCYSCHGTLQSRGAPAPDLKGSSRVSDVTVGLHQIHISDNDLRVGIPCSSCHMMPSNNNDPGHMDTDHPAEVIFDDLASGRLREGPMAHEAKWDRETGTCTNVYCHSRSQGAVGAVWHWTKKLDHGMHCQSCHKGKPQYPLQYCIVCHLSAYRDGQINPDTHLNGRMDWSL